MFAKHKKVKLVLAWHMHQPYYFNSQTGQYQLPWTYLHAIKDYSDMANIIAEYPQAKAVVNFAPILLEQIEDYRTQIDGFFANDREIKDPLLANLANEDLDESNKIRTEILNACLRSNEQHLINRYESYTSLVEIAKKALSDESCLLYLNHQFFHDLLVWYHIAWMGETIKRENKTIKRLIDKKHNFTTEDRRQLLEIIQETISNIIPTYKRLSETGQVELSFSPYAHPIIPLLIDFDTNKDAMPDADLPQHKNYPGGEERARWHFKKGIDIFENYFGHRPHGCWPSEGAVSDDTIRLCHDFEIKWAASGENVMRNSIDKTPALHDLLKGECLHRSYTINHSDTRLFFRDDGLSDLIGFTFSDWHSDDAVNNLIHHIENIAQACEYDKNTVISIILDGENAWEHYPENGYHFLDTLYSKLAKHKHIDLTTFSDCIDQGIESAQLDKINAGSWVYGTFSTWIGDKDKNLAWDLLVDAKLAYDEVINSNKLDNKKRQAAENQLAICEGSDWFWWFGDYNPSDSVQDFEQLYRIQLKELYRLLELPPPDKLSQTISKGGGQPTTGGVMRPGQEGHPY